MKYSVEHIVCLITSHELVNGRKVQVKKEFTATVKVSEEISVEVPLSKELIEQIEHEASVKADILIAKAYMKESDESSKHTKTEM